MHPGPIATKGESQVFDDTNSSSPTNLWIDATIHYHLTVEARPRQRHLSACRTRC